MVKKAAKSLNLLKDLSRIASGQNLDSQALLTHFLDSLAKEISADYLFIVDTDARKLFYSSAINDELLRESFAGDRAAFEKELASLKIPNWGYLHIKFPCDASEKNLRLKAFSEDTWETLLSFLAVYLYANEIKDREDLISTLTSELRKTLRPDIALEKLQRAMQDYLGLKGFYFFKKLGEHDEAESKYEVVSQNSSKELPSILSYKDIKSLGFIKDKAEGELHVEIFESKLRQKQWGLLVLTKPTKWNDLDRGLVKPFAEQMATVFSQNELHSESLSMAQREFLLNQITTTIRESLEVDEIIRIASQEIAQVMGVDSCGILMLDKQIQGTAKYAVWSADQGVTNQMHELLPGLEDYELIPRSPDEVINLSLFSEGDNTQIAQLKKAHGIKACLIAPLFKHNTEELMGVVVLGLFKQSRCWSQEEEQLLESIAKQLEVALLQAAIYQDSQQTKRQMALLHKLSSDIRNSLDISIVLGSIASGLGEVLGLSRCFVRRLDENKRVMKTEQEYTTEGIAPSADIIFDFEEEWIEKISEQDAQTNSYEFLNIPYLRSTLADQDSSWLSIVNTIKLKSYLAIPLIARDRVLGTINVHQCDRERNFLAEEIEFIARVASEAAVAVEHAELFATIDRFNKVDPDTGLYNKRYFREVAIEEIAKAKERNEDISLMMLDMDYLKEINDTPGIGGHDAGDEAILKVSRCFEKTVRQTPIDEVRTRRADVVGRFGGDEFMILLPNTSIIQAQRVAERIYEGLAKVEHSSWTKPLSVSIGIAGTPNDKYDYEDLKRRADKALYLSKEKGRGTASSSIELD